jgi:hypothetical protein
MWKAPLHVGTDGVVCLLLPSKVLLANQVDDFQAAWFARFAVDAIWQLADFSFILFKGADCPAVIIRFRATRPAAEDAEITYVVPKVSHLSSQAADIMVLSDDRKSLLLAEVLDAAERDRAVSVWKKHFWGTGRDQELLNRLLSMPRLNQLAGKPGQKRWSKGGGFQPFHEGLSKGKPKEPSWEESGLYLDTKAEVEGLILLPDDCDRIGDRFQQLRRRPEEAIFSPPMVLFNRVGSKVAFVSFPLLFQHTLSSITGPPGDTDLLLFLAAVLNSRLARYFLFHTSANWGVERDTVLLEEYLRVPFPLPEETRRPRTSRAIVAKVARRLQKTKMELESLQADLFLGFAEQRRAITDAAREEVSEFVSDYYGLCDWERALVADTVEVLEPSSTPASLDSYVPALRRAESDDYRAYADLLSMTLNGWLSRQPWKLTPSARINRKSGLGLLTLSRSEEPGTFVERPGGAEFEKALLRVQEASGRRASGIAYARGFVLFEATQFHIVKPLTLRHWTKTAALNDADALMGFMSLRG